jgi:hypothetical protein
LGPSCQPYPERGFDQGAAERLGCRICLLKGCNRAYRPKHPLSRYCSSACVDAAARWRQCLANRRYRASEQGKSLRRAQASRHRQRVRERPAAASSPCAGGEGHGYAGRAQDSCCQRPGCYETFLKTARSPQQKFCNARCRQALYRVWVRERRWWRKWRGDVPKGWRGDDSW